MHDRAYNAMQTILSSNKKYNLRLQAPAARLQIIQLPHMP